MAANTVPIFIKIPNTPSVRLTTAETTHDGTGATTLFTAGADGSRVDVITFTASSTTSGSQSGAARVGKVYIVTSGVKRLFKEVVLATITASNTAIGQTGIVTFTNGLLLKFGQSIEVSVSVVTNTTDTVDVIAQGGDF